MLYWPRPVRDAASHLFDEDGTRGFDRERRHQTRTCTAWNYTSLGGIPASVTYLAKPVRAARNARNVGLFAQNQWTVRRLTLNVGVRLDTLHGTVPGRRGRRARSRH